MMMPKSDAVWNHDVRLRTNTSQQELHSEIKSWDGLGKVEET